MSYEGWKKAKVVPKKYGESVRKYENRTFDERLKAKNLKTPSRPVREDYETDEKYLIEREKYREERKKYLVRYQKLVEHEINKKTKIKTLSQFTDKMEKVGVSVDNSLDKVGVRVLSRISDVLPKLLKKYPEVLKHYEN